jgi:calpain-15
VEVIFYIASIISGDWGDSSALWTPPLKEKYKLLTKNDGVFYMTVKDFRKYFESIDILYFRDFYEYQSRPIEP